MQEITSIRTLRQFLRAARLRGAVCRGQIEDHGSLKPSRFRAQTELPVEQMRFLFSDEYERVYRELEEQRKAARERHEPQPDGTLQWLGLAPWPDDDEPQLGPIFDTLDFRPPGHGFLGPSPDWPAPLGWEAIARLQHYGVPTAALDVTYNPLVALWFAAHRFVPGRGRTGHYAPSEAAYGVVYVLRPPESRVYDLRRDRGVPIGGLRGLRQQGGLLIDATADAPDLSLHVTRKLRVPTSLVYEAGNLLERLHRSIVARRLRRLDQRFLFPDEVEDPFYGLLLAAKRGENSELLRSFNPLPPFGGYSVVDDRELDRDFGPLVDCIIEYGDPPGSATRERAP